MNKAIYRTKLYNHSVVTIKDMGTTKKHASKICLV
jgi:hypothetical protein